MKRKIELLSPAKDAATAIEAIMHGADAVYMGAKSHGARASAANSIDDVKRVVDFAHTFNAKIYATVNTIVYNNELRHVERLIRDLYKIGVDALIVQDMGILRLDIPPIQLHASTQCDTRTPEKAEFLQSVGFSQIVLARELTLGEIENICKSVTVPIETFIHGALCVSYSGRCHLSQALQGRSANRGECAQFCRLPYTLKDATGRVIAKDKHLLSLKDFNLSDRIEDLMKAGVSSFKIEGRLKDVAYVKNVTAYYRNIIDLLIRQNPDLYERSSCGKSEITFNPNLYKSFNRGFTHYFLDNRRPRSIASIHTPKSLGEPISEISQINNGDGISFFNKNGQYDGFKVNKIEHDRIIPAKKISIPENTILYRTFDQKWEKIMSGATGKRLIAVDIEIDEKGATATDERGNYVRIALDVDKDIVKNYFNPRQTFEKLGGTNYYLRHFDNNLDPTTFIPISQLSSLRRTIIEMLDAAASVGYKYSYRKEENSEANYPSCKLDYRDNVANDFARKFYFSHGIKSIENALETQTEIKQNTVLMTCRHCILRELNLCKRDGQFRYKEPLKLMTSDNVLTLKFNCEICEMCVLS